VIVFSLGYSRCLIFSLYSLVRLIGYDGGMTFTIMPDDDWHTYVYVHFSWLCCEKCGREPPSLEWAWKGVEPGELGAKRFTVRAVEQLKAEGWTMQEELRCHECSSKNSYT
jgi:hypothetical protein